MKLLHLSTLISLLLASAIAGKLPGYRHYRGEVPSSRFHGMDFIENSQDFECEEELTSTFTNGTCHNLDYPNFGLTDNVEIRYGEALYGDGLEEPNGRNRPSPRLISNTVIQQPEGLDSNLKGMTRLLIFLGQFIDHDFALTLEQEEPDGEEMPIEIPGNDPVFTENEMEFFRSEFCRVNGVRQFTTINTPWFDLSTVYGDDQERTDLLRLFQDGLLNTTDEAGREFPPLNENDLYECGDVRCEENTMLLAFHTLFLREHNRIARGILATGSLLGEALPLAATPEELDEFVFQEARLLNIAQYQSIIWDFYLPYLVGRRTLLDLAHEYEGFKHGVDPTLSVEFATAVYRYGHSGVSNDLRFENIDGDTVRDPIALADAFENREPLLEDPSHMAAIFLGQSNVAHDILDQFVVSGIRDELFANLPQFEPGFDLIARNMQRCREHGCQSLNYYRALFGLEPYMCAEDDQLDCFLQMTGDEELAQQLFDLYGDFEECDLFVCGMSEQDFEDSLLGETFTVMIVDQFNRIREGDRIWYELVIEEFNQTLLDELVITFPSRLSDVIVNNLAADLDGTEELEGAFLLAQVFPAMIEADRFQVEWADPPSLRENTDEYTITVTSPDGSSQEFTVDGARQFSRELFVVVENAQPDSEYMVTVVGERLDNGQDVTIGTISVNTLSSEGGDEGDGLIAGLEPGAFAGVIGGVVGGVAILGIGAAVVVRRRNNNYQKDLNAAFF